jgi:hypothetical protein
MTTLFAPPELLSAYAYAVDGADVSQPLPKGTHLRVFAGTSASFPLTPFVVYRVRLQASECDLNVTDATGNPVNGLDLSQLGSAEITLIPFDTETRRTALAELHATPDDGLDSAQLLDQQGRVVAGRDAGRFLFSAPRLHGFRVSGTATSMWVGSRSFDISAILSPVEPLEPP